MIHSNPLRAIGPTWQRFWHPRGETFSLGVFRLFFAFCLLLEVPITQSLSAFAIEGGFHLPYSFIPSWIHPVSAQTYHLIHIIQYPLIIMLGAGILMRTAVVGLIGLQGYILFSDALHFRNHPYFFLLVLVILLFSQADESFSIKSLWRGHKKGLPLLLTLIGPLRSLCFQRMIMVQVSIVYLFAGVHKLNPAFLTGTVLRGELGRTLPEWSAGITSVFGIQVSDFLQWIILSEFALVSASIGTVILEFTIPFTLWMPKTRIPSIAAGIVFHILIWLLMGIPTFSLAMVGTYILFLNPKTLPALITRRVNSKILKVKPTEEDG